MRVHTGLATIDHRSYPNAAILVSINVQMLRTWADEKKDTTATAFSDDFGNLVL